MGKQKPKILNVISQAIESEENNFQTLKTLKERAAKLARPKVEDKVKKSQTYGIGFLLSEEKFIIESSFVVEVMPLSDYTPVPGTPAFMLGVINFHGKVISVINLKNFLNLPDKGLTNLNKVIVVKHNDLEVGLLTDEITGNVVISDVTMQGGKKLNLEGAGEYIKGVTNGREVLFNVEKFLTSDQILINDQV